MSVLSSLDHAIDSAKALNDYLRHPTLEGPVPPTPVEKDGALHRLSNIFATHAATIPMVVPASSPDPAPRQGLREDPNTVTRADPHQALRVAPLPETPTEEPTAAPRVPPPTEMEKLPPHTPPCMPPPLCNRYPPLLEYPNKPPAAQPQSAQRVSPEPPVPLLH